VSEPNLSGYACSLCKVVNNLIIKQRVCVNIFSFECPLEIEARGVLVFVFNPASLLECSFDITVSTSYNEHFCVFVNSILLLPSRHISNIKEDFVLGYVALDEILEGRVILLASSLFRGIIIIFLSL
jgi:hypothetical protein